MDIVYTLYIVQACAALLPSTHPSLCPCMLYRGFVKIADFGVSRNLSNSAELSKTFVGTVGYMSPERIQGTNPPLQSTYMYTLGIIYLIATSGQILMRLPSGPVR